MGRISLARGFNPTGPNSSNRFCQLMIWASEERSKRRRASLKDKLSSRIAVRTDNLNDGLKILFPFLGRSPTAPRCLYILYQVLSSEQEISNSLPRDSAEQ